MVQDQVFIRKQRFGIMDKVLYICIVLIHKTIKDMSKDLKGLWMKESTEFTMEDGTIVNGYRVSFVRMMKDGESIDDIDEQEELMDLMGGSSGVEYTDENLMTLENEDEIVDEVPSMEYQFYLE